MATNVQLKAEPRSETGKGANRKMRAAGRVPAVVYGHGESTRMLSVDAHEIELVFSRVHRENTIFQLDIEGESGEVRALVREVQQHPYRGNLLHIDFQQIHAGEELHVEVPIRLVGTAPGVRAGGVLVQPLTQIEVWCTPDRIPEYIDADISELTIGDSIHLRDVTLPEGVTTTVDGDQTICSVAPPTVPVEVEPTEEAPTEEPMVIRRGKEEEED